MFDSPGKNIGELGFADFPQEFGRIETNRRWFSLPTYTFVSDTGERTPLDPPSDSNYRYTGASCPG